MPRLFTGIKIPFQIAQSLTMTRARLPGARWMEPSDYHITLRFIGDISEELAVEIDLHLARLSFTPFDLSISQLDIFGTKKPRTFYARVQESRELSQLHKTHENLMRQLGLKPESRKFAPHVTLARLSTVRRENIAVFMEQAALPHPLDFRVNECHLFSARQSTGGGPYLIENSYPFIP